MKNIILLFALAISQLSFSQSKSSIDVIGGVDYSYRVLRKLDDSHITNSMVEFRDRETPNIGYRAGINYNHTISSVIHIKSGIRFSSYGYNYDNNIDNPRVEDQDDPLIGESVSINAKYFFRFIEIPLIARFQLNNNKVSPFAEIGVSNNIYINTRTKAISNSASTSIHYNEFYNRFHLVGIISLGSNYTISEKTQLFAQAMFRYHITPLNESGTIKEHLYNIGLELGARYYL